MFRNSNGNYRQGKYYHYYDYCSNFQGWNLKISVIACLAEVLLFQAHVICPILLPLLDNYRRLFWWYKYLQQRLLPVWLLRLSQVSNICPSLLVCLRNWRVSTETERTGFHTSRKTGMPRTHCSRVGTHHNCLQTLWTTDETTQALQISCCVCVSGRIGGYPGIVPLIALCHTRCK